MKINENDVIKHVSSYLEKNGYEIISSCDTSQHGYDLIATKGGKYLYIEAKGQTSSDPNSSRYGKEFDHSQKVDHVAKAIYKTMKTQNQEKNCKTAIALPSDNVHKNIITNILPSLKKLDITTFYVDEKGNVEEVQ